MEKRLLAGGNKCYVCLLEMFAMVTVTNYLVNVINYNFKLIWLIYL